MGAGVLAGMPARQALAAEDASPGNTQVADAPHSSVTQQRVPFYGKHQAGIVTPGRWRAW